MQTYFTSACTISRHRQDKSLAAFNQCRSMPLHQGLERAISSTAGRTSQVAPTYSTNLLLVRIGSHRLRNSTVPTAVEGSMGVNLHTYSSVRTCLPGTKPCTRENTSALDRPCDLQCEVWIEV